MDMSVTIAYVPGSIDLEAGLAALGRMSDEDLVALAPLGILGWGWDLPSEAPTRAPWEDDDTLAVLGEAGQVPDALAGRYAAAARTSIARCLEHAAVLLGGGHAWFEGHVATRLPVAPAGQLLLCPEDSSGSGEDCAYCDIVRLPVEVVPELGRAMGAYGRGDLDLTVTLRAAG